MAADVLARILRGEPKSTKPGGTGLGTRIVYNAVAAHRGVFEGESTAGAGTTFRLLLPLVARPDCSATTWRACSGCACGVASQRSIALRLHCAEPCRIAANGTERPATSAAR